MGFFPAMFLVHTVTVETFQGTTAHGPTWATAQSVTGWLDDQTHLVRNGKDEEVIAQSAFYAPIESAALFAEDSRLTLPSGRKARVITTNANDSGALPLPAHVEVHLT
jgi:hypothetical protein